MEGKVDNIDKKQKRTKNRTLRDFLYFLYCKGKYVNSFEKCKFRSNLAANVINMLCLL